MPYGVIPEMRAEISLGKYGKVGYTAPSVEGQSEVISMALAAAGIDPGTIGYVEAHGTGTALGDPIEVAALTQAFRGRRSREASCAIGAVKSNIGHLDAAAGVAGLIKTVLCLKHAELVPTLFFGRPNPQIDFERGAFSVSAELREWGAKDGVPRRAGVSSFGIGGTNAHAVVEEPPARGPSGPSREWQLLLLSAKTRTALSQATEKLAGHLRSTDDVDLADAAYTLKVGRQQYDHRRAVLCRNVEGAISALEGSDGSRVWTESASKGQPEVVFMFSGQGAQYPDMGRELYEKEPVFREVVDRCSERLAEDVGFDLRDAIFLDRDRAQHGAAPDKDVLEAAAERLKQTSITQPALFVIELALARLWMSWGVFPKAMIGHSIGEYVAACLSGVLSEADALRVVCERGRLMEAAPAGSMLAVALTQEQTEALLGDELSLASVNGPSSCVVSGPHDHVQALEDRLTEKGVVCHRLRTSHAFHSGLVEGAHHLFAYSAFKAVVGGPPCPGVARQTAAAPRRTSDVQRGAFADG